MCISPSTLPGRSHCWLEGLKTLVGGQPASEGYSIETDVILATVAGVRQGRVDTDSASRADKTILQLLRWLSLRLTFLLLLLRAALLPAALLPA